MAYQVKGKHYDGPRTRQSRGCGEMWTVDTAARILDKKQGSGIVLKVIYQVGPAENHRVGWVDVFKVAQSVGALPCTRQASQHTHRHVFFLLHYWFRVHTEQRARLDLPSPNPLPAP